MKIRKGRKGPGIHPSITFGKDKDNTIRKRKKRSQSWRRIKTRTSNYRG
jgi:hypothetical protein